MVISRDEPPLPVARWRAEGRLAELGPGDLAMDPLEAGRLLAAARVELADGEVAELTRRTEGWPVALYLAALSIKAQHPRNGAGVGFERPGSVPGRLPAVGAAVGPVADRGPVPDPDLGAGSAVGAAVRRGAGHQRVGGGPCVAGAVQPAGRPAGSPAGVVPLPPAIPGAAAWAAGTLRARAGARAHPPSGPMVPAARSGRGRDRLRHGRRRCRPGRPRRRAGGHRRLPQRPAGHRPALVRLVRRPRADPAVSRGGHARGLDPGARRPRGRCRAVG